MLSAQYSVRLRPDEERVRAAALERDLLARVASDGRPDLCSLVAQKTAPARRL